MISQTLLGNVIVTLTHKSHTRTLYYHSNASFYVLLIYIDWVGLGNLSLYPF